jgi:hypothetical protein
LSFWAIHSGTTRPSTGCPGSEARTGTAWGLSPPGTVPVPAAAPGPFTKARGTGLAAEVNGSLRGDGPCLDRSGPPTLALGPRFGALSDEAGPQPASPARSVRLRSSVRCEHSRRRHGRDGCIASDLSGGAGDGGSGTVRTRVLLLRRCVGCWPETNRPVCIPRTSRPTRRRDDGRAGRCRRCE